LSLDDKQQDIEEFLRWLLDRVHEAQAGRPRAENRLELTEATAGQHQRYHAEYLSKSGASIVTEALSALSTIVTVCKGCNRTVEWVDASTLLAISLPVRRTIRFVNATRTKSLLLRVPVSGSDKLSEMCAAAAHAAASDSQRLVLAVVAGQEVTWFPPGDLLVNSILPHHDIFAFESDSDVTARFTLVQLRFVARGESQLTYKLDLPHVLRLPSKATVAQLHEAICKLMRVLMPKRQMGPPVLATAVGEMAIDAYEVIQVKQNGQQVRLALDDSATVDQLYMHANEQIDSIPFVSLQVQVSRPPKAVLGSSRSGTSPVRCWDPPPLAFLPVDSPVTLETCLRLWSGTEEMSGENKYQCNVCIEQGKGLQDATKTVKLRHGLPTQTEQSCWQTQNKK
jgi:hypothetical protein